MKLSKAFDSVLDAEISKQDDRQAQDQSFLIDLLKVGTILLLMFTEMEARGLTELSISPGGLPITLGVRNCGLAILRTATIYNNTSGHAQHHLRIDDKGVVVRIDAGGPNPTCMTDVHLIKDLLPALETFTEG